MAQFEEKYPIDAFRVYRPTVSTKENAKAWWRYAILAEVYKVRCKQREELWRVAGNKGLNILSHIRFIIAEKGNMDNMDDEEVNENYVTETVRKLKNLQNTVSDLNRDNMVLRKMLKTLFTPLAVENFASDEITLQDIEQEIAIFESRALTASKRLTFEDIDQPSQSFDCDSQCEGIMESGKAADFEVLESLASSVGTPDLNIRSPYENLLPPIDIQDTKVVPKKNNKAGSPKSPRLKAVRPKDKLFPSYLEREAMRKENAAKKKERANLVRFGGIATQRCIC